MSKQARWAGNRPNPIELVASHLYKDGTWRNPAPGVDIVKALWKMDRMVPILMGGCLTHDEGAHDALILSGGQFPCRMAGPRQWYIFKVVRRALGDYPVMLYNLAGEDDTDGFRPLDERALIQIRQIQQKHKRDQVETVIREDAARKRAARLEAHQGIEEVLEPHLNGMRKEFDQFNVSGMPADPADKAKYRKISNLYINQRTAAE